MRILEIIHALENEHFPRALEGDEESIAVMMRIIELRKVLMGG